MNRTIRAIVGASVVMAIGLPAMAIAEEAAGAAGDGGRVTRRAERFERMKEKREAKYGERVAAAEKRYEQFVARLKEHLAARKRLSDAEKEDILKFVEQQRQENVTFRETQHGENMKFLDDLAAKPDLTGKEIKQMFKDHFETQKSENRAHRAEQKSERKAEKEKVRGEIRDNK